MLSRYGIHSAKLLTIAESEDIPPKVFTLLSPGPNLDKKCVWLLDSSPAHEIFRKIYSVEKPPKKGLKREW